jgi:hypothetical protein
MKLLVILFNVALSIIILIAISKVGMPSPKKLLSFLAVLLAIVTPAINLLYIFFCSRESWLGLYFKRKAMEEKMSGKPRIIPIPGEEAQIPAPAKKPWEMTPEEIAREYYRRQTEGETEQTLGSWDRSAISNWAKGSLARMAKRLKKGEWKTLDELTPKKDDRDALDALAALRDMGYSQIAWDAEGQPYHSKANSKLPDNLFSRGEMEEREAIEKEGLPEGAREFLKTRGTAARVGIPEGSLITRRAEYKNAK